MGCGLRKFRQAEDNSPGKIYSTLKRPQVETKIGVAYTYHHLDFLVGKDGKLSVILLSLMRELPSQLQDLYQQGFILAAVHPFVHPCGPEPTSVQRQLYRAVLIKVSDRWGHNTPNGNMTAALNSTGGADIYYRAHISLFIFVSGLKSSDVIIVLYNVSLLHQKHHNFVFMSIFHPPTDPSTGFCATVPLRLHVLVLG
uniref:Raftlin, lipid raft linker 1a n=1 Tax=Sinocyclocheilus anshuiensis TaxID=1608454 RepID=A0A671RJZ0_9TELE